METINDRIKKTRTDAGLSQRAFSKGVGVTASSINKIESGENNPSEQTVRLISSTYKVNYQWLKTGEGPMYLPAPESDIDLIMDVLGSDNEFSKRVMRVFSRLDDATWLVLKELVEQLLEEEGLQQGRED